MGLPCPQSPTVHPQLLTVGQHGYVCWVNVMFYGSGKHSKQRVQHSLLGMGMGGGCQVFSYEPNLGAH